VCAKELALGRAVAAPAELLWADDTVSKRAFVVVVEVFAAVAVRHMIAPRAVEGHVHIGGHGGHGGHGGQRGHSRGSRDIVILRVHRGMSVLAPLVFAVMVMVAVARFGCRAAATRPGGAEQVYCENRVGWSKLTIGRGFPALLCNVALPDTLCWSVSETRGRYTLNDLMDLVEPPMARCVGERERERGRGRIKREVSKKKWKKREKKKQTSSRGIK
jgi:hypothetical protein